MAGRKAKPMVVSTSKISKDERKKREELEKAIKFNSDKIIIPTWIEGEYAIEEWNRTVKELTEKELITNCDLSSLGFLCDCLQLALDARSDIRINGLTYNIEDNEGNIRVKKNPAVGIHQDYIKLYKSLCAEFGLTPSSRVRITLNNNPGKEEKESPFATLIKLKHGS